MEMEKITIILTVAVLSFAFTPLVSGLCDQEKLAECANTFNRSFSVFFSEGRQDTVYTMQLYCRTDVQSAVICIKQESAKCLNHTSLSPSLPILTKVNAETLPDGCNELSKIPGDALIGLNNAINMSYTQISQCISTELRSFDLCSMILGGQKCEDRAIKETIPNYTSELSVYHRVAKNFYSCSDLSYFASTPLVSGLCDQQKLAECTNKFSRAFSGFYAQQDTISTMQLYCRSDVQSAFICIEQESAKCLNDTSYSSLSPFMRMVNAENLQENCNVLSKIPGDALICLNKALDMSNTQLFQCIMSASKNIANSLTQTGFKALDVCSIILTGQKCQDQAIEETCPSYKSELSDYNQLAKKFYSCSDLSSSAGKTPMTSIFIAACFAILKMLHD